MPRPTVVVGLGGTGQWVLTWLKRDLMLANNGEMPGNVQLLEIDTATKLEAGATRVTTSGVKEEAAVVGGVSLGKEEFIYIGGDAFKLAEDVRDGKYRQIGMWYPAARWLASQTPAAFVLDDGAGRLRQFGRLAVFKDVLGRETESKLWQSLRNKIQKVQNLANEQRRLEIILVGSFAGGTGSGMLIDIAVILRMLAQQLGVHHVLRGFIALPSVFTGAPDEQMKARTFAAWRELNRFMVVDPDFPMPTIEFVEHSSTFRIQPKSRLFDCCYLVEGMRGGRPIAEEAKYGVFPMVSEVVSAIIDEEAGTAYAQWVTTNLAPAYARFPDRPMYSAVGAYTVQVPAHFKQEISSHEFAKGFLLSLLQPRRDPDDDGRLEAGVLALAATNKNLEDRGFAGRQRCERLFKETIERDGRTTKPTLFHARIAELHDAISEQNRRAATVDLLSRAGGSMGNQQASGAGWVIYFPNLGDDPTFEATRKEVAEHMIYNVVNQYKRKDGETGEEARARFRKISDDVRTRFGGISGSGEEIEEYYGQCGDSLEKAKRVQLILFRKMVATTLTNLLMGRSENPIEARSGKLGYARDYFDGAAAVLDSFLKLMDDVKTRRNEIKPELRLSGLSEQARRVLNENAGKKFLLFWESPNVRKTEEAYLQAQQRLVDVRREDILHTYVVTTAREMKEICTETRDALERWILHLSVGDASRHVDGLWEGVRGDLKQIKSAHGFDDKSPKVQKIVSDATIAYTQEDLKKALQRWQWVVEFAGDPPRPVIKAVIASEEQNQENAELVEPTAKESPQVRKELSRENQHKLVGLMRVPYAGVAATANVADEIRNQYPSAAAFVEEIASVSAEPLFDGGTAASSLKKSNLIRIQTPPNDPYFKTVEAKLREKAHVNVEKMDDTYGIQLVGSENPYKLTLVRTNDLYFHDAFASWEDCLLAYDKHIKDKEDDPMDPVLMQNFSAEQRAAEYERRLRKSGEGYRPLHPRVVMLLEDPEALRQFCYLGMLGLIKVKDTPKYHWELTWERESGPETLWLTKGWTIQDKAQRPDPPDLFSAAHGYVIWKFNQRDGWDNRIDTEFAERVIERELEKWERRGGEEAMLKQALQPGGFVASLKKLARSKDTGIVSDQRFEDLAHVVEMIITDRLDILGARTGGAGDSIFGGGPEKAKKPAAKKPAAKKPAAKKTTPASKAKPAAKPAAKKPAAKPAAKPAVRKTTKKSE